MTRQFDVVLVDLDPTRGSEIRKTRPCLVISPDDMNRHLRTVIVAPMTSKGFSAAFRASLTFQEVQGLVVLDQMRAIDKQRIVKTLGAIDKKTKEEVKDILARMFA